MIQPTAGCWFLSHFILKITLFTKATTYIMKQKQKNKKKNTQGLFVYLICKFSGNCLQHQGVVVNGPIFPLHDKTNCWSFLLLCFVRLIGVHCSGNTPLPGSRRSTFCWGALEVIIRNTALPLRINIVR